MAGHPSAIPDLRGSSLVISRVRLDGYLRIYPASHANPLGYRKTPSRFSDPRRRFGVVYMNTTLKGSFVEAVLRDRAVGGPSPFMLNESEIAALNVVEIQSTRELRLVDLRGDGIVRMRLPTDVAHASSQDLSQRASLEFYRHRERPDGIVFHSRLNGSVNVAVYGRAVRLLRPIGTSALMTAAGLTDILDDFVLAIRRRA